MSNNKFLEKIAGRTFAGMMNRISQHSAAAAKVIPAVTKAQGPLAGVSKSLKSESFISRYKLKALDSLKKIPSKLP